MFELYINLFVPMFTSQSSDNNITVQHAALSTLKLIHKYQYCKTLNFGQP